jgi:hypothetical protein
VDQDVGGGGVCGKDGVCVCNDNYDPSQCCGVPLPGGATPAGYGQPCAGLSKKTVQLYCSGSTNSACGACPPGAIEGSDFILQPDGHGGFQDQIGNLYQLNEAVCHLTSVHLSARSNGGMCGLPSDQGFWVKAAGAAGTAVSGLICAADCTDCLQTVNCTVTIH